MVIILRRKLSTRGKAYPCPVTSFVASCRLNGKTTGKPFNFDVPTRREKSETVERKDSHKIVLILEYATFGCLAGRNKSILFTYLYIYIHIKPSSPHTFKLTIFLP